MKREIAISDIHACYLTFLKLLEKINYNTQADKLYILGDCIDRGPSSKQVLDWIMDKQDGGAEILVLKGNHEDLMLRASESPKRYDLWMRNGGQQVVDSFELKDFLDIDKKYWDFLNALPYYHLTEKYVLVHAGLNFDLDDPLADLESLIWIRKWHDNINKEWLGDRIIVHGHTQVSVSEIEDQFDDLNTDQVINIDAGCYAANYKPDLGYLCAFDLTNNALFFEKNVDAIRWFPPI